jgi:hypothetical protein
MENVGTFYGRWEYFTDIWYILCMVILYIFHRFGVLCQEKSGNPALLQRAVF